MSEDELSFESLAWDDIRKWQNHLRGVERALVELRAATPESDVEARQECLKLASARARDAESNAIYPMKRYGYADGVTVPGIGAFRVVWHDDGLKTLEPLPP